MIQIPNPCNEDWSKMQIVRDGRHCLNCQKNVIHFTQMERYQILEYLYQNKDESVCGLIYPNQIDIDYTDLYVNIEGITKQSKSKTLPFYLLTTLSLYLASCEDEPSLVVGEFVKYSEVIPSKQMDTLFFEKETAPQYEKSIEIQVYGGMPSSGSICIVSNEPYEKLLENAEITDFSKAKKEYASYPSSIFSLGEFVKNELIYPQKELKKGITGVVFIQFDILESGKLANAKAIKNSAQSIEFELAAIEVLNKMPNWNPATVNGKPIKTNFTLPILFEIKKH